MQQPPALSMIACKVCLQVYVEPVLPPGTVARCVRCRARLGKRSPYSMHITAAFALAALILYVPANIFPIIHMELKGAVSENTVWEGCVRLWQAQDYIIAVIVFLASMLVPFLKLLALVCLVASRRLHVERWKRARTRMYRFVDGIGRWAMLDVFVVAVLVSLVKLQDLATIMPGKGLFAFTAMAVLTILATENFDPQLIWESDPAR
jgi:paraquat-inducible protein A